LKKFFSGRCTRSSTLPHHCAGSVLSTCSDWISASGSRFRRSTGNEHYRIISLTSLPAGSEIQRDANDIESQSVRRVLGLSSRSSEISSDALVQSHNTEFHRDGTRFYCGDGPKIPSVLPLQIGKTGDADHKL
jgi:hypothetical protein